MKRRTALKAAAAAVVAGSTKASAAGPSFMLETMGKLTVTLGFKDRDGKESTQTFELGALGTLASHVGEYTVEVLNVRASRKDVLARGTFRHIYSIE
ncbi:MAG: hypothetical protein QM817_34570 [Archangium sp.]